VSDFKPKNLAILGRQPALGLAELESLYGADHIQPISGAALLDMAVEEIEFKRLGGTVKLAKVLNILPITGWLKLQEYLAQTIPKHLKHMPEGKFNLGLSLYNFNLPVSIINRGLLELKEVIKSSGRPMRVVPNKTPALNSAQVLHNKLTTRGAWELIFVRDGSRTILAQTFFVQDIEAYAGRDQTRPKRDARVGMLPPKLAQIIINLANPPAQITILDPFCGTGVILQEALLMGYNIIGSDIDSRMVNYAHTNIKWLIEQNPKITGRVVLELADATADRWPPFSSVASELALGPPLNSPPADDVLKKITKQSNDLLERFLRNLATQIKSGQTISLALPAWRLPSGGFKQLPVLDKLTEIGYNYSDFIHAGREELLYFRQDQIVARQLVRLRKS
jgi:tRNA G10  N-methylase Trm11